MAEFCRPRKQYSELINLGQIQGDFPPLGRKGIKNILNSEEEARKLKMLVRKSEKPEKVRVHMFPPSKKATVEEKSGFRNMS